MNSFSCRDYVPEFLAYEHVKVPIPGGGRHWAKVIFIFCWRDTIHFPDVPVFHAQPALDPQSQYGNLTMIPKSMFPKVRPTDCCYPTTTACRAVGCIPVGINMCLCNMYYNAVQ